MNRKQAWDVNECNKAKGAVRVMNHTNLNIIYIALLKDDSNFKRNKEHDYSIGLSN